MLDIDPNHQRGKNSVTGKEVVNEGKVERWVRQLQDDTAIFGQLTWKFRPEYRMSGLGQTRMMQLEGHLCCVMMSRLCPTPAIATALLNVR